MAKRYYLFVHDPDDPVRIDALVAMVTLAAALTLAASISFESGYLAFFGLLLTDVPSTVADYTTHALYWLPWIVLVTVLVGTTTLTVLNLLESIRPHSPPREPAFEPFRAVVLGSLLFFIGAVGALLALGDLGVFWATGILASWWQYFARWALRHPKIGHEFNALERRIAYYTPVLALLAFGLGWYNGWYAIGHPGYRPTAVVESANRPPQVVQMLNSYERGILFLRDGTVSFVDWDHVLVINRPARRHWISIFRTPPPTSPASP